MIKHSSLLILIFIGFTNCKSPQKKEVLTKKPNIVWVMAEDMSVDLECYGMKAVKTPNFNKMASEGVLFENCFVTNSICSPSRSAMMIGTHQIKTNSHNHRSNRNIAIDTQFVPFTQKLREVGYTTILGNQSVMKKGRKIDVNFKHKAIGEWDGKTKFGLFDKYDTIKKSDEPFFAQIQLVATHRGDWWNKVREESKHPVDPNQVELPAYYADHPAIRLDWAKYLDQVEYIDHEIGMIFKELEAKGVAENTIVIFIGDNGRCNIRGKGYLHDSGLRIPYIIHYPKGLKGGQVRSDVISSTDITATILDFAGIETPGYMTGKPMFSKDFKRDYVYASRDLWDEIEEKSRAITSNKWKYIRNDKPEIPFDAHQAYLEFYRPAVHIMRRLKKQGKLNQNQSIFFEDSKPLEELYDLKNDPQELVNLVGNSRYLSVLEDLRAKTKIYDKEYKPVNDAYEPTSVQKTVALVPWLKKEKPEVYKQMEEGVEVGFHKWMKVFKQNKK